MSWAKKAIARLRVRVEKIRSETNWRLLALQGGIAAGSWVTAQLSSTVGAGRPDSPAWPVPGLALALVMLVGRGVWPGLALGWFVAVLTTFPAHGVNPLA